MCSNGALVDNMECYMDELVESFQDFVRKSLFMITLAVGSLIGILLYILKLVKQRNDNFICPARSMTGVCRGVNTPGTNEGRSAIGTDPKTIGTDLKMGGTDPKSDSFFNPSTPKKSCCNPSCGMSSSVSSNFVGSPKPSKELEIKNIGISNCTTKCIKRNQPDRSSSKITIPSAPLCDPACKTKPFGAIAKASSGSCCSNCCGEQSYKPQC